MNRRVTLVTPTFSGDLERFCLQRESIERCGIDLPHVAIVDHEDLPVFRDIPFNRGLTLVSTRDVLSRKIEQRRLAWGMRRREPKRWWFTRAGEPIHGWGIQQLLKLSAPSVVDTEGIVCLDCDTFFVRTITAEDFFSIDGRLHLYETNDDIDAEMAEWPSHCMRFLGIKPTGQRLWRYTHSPVPLRRDVLLDMQVHIQKLHCRPWAEAFIDQRDWVLEYTTYGVYARHINGLEGVAPVHPPLSVYYWWPEQAESLERDFSERISGDQAKAVLVNSNIARPVSLYRHLAEEAWSKVGQQKQTVTI